MALEQPRMNRSVIFFIILSVYMKLYLWFRFFFIFSDLQIHLIETLPQYDN